MVEMASVVSGGNGGWKWEMVQCSGEKKMEEKWRGKNGDKYNIFDKHMS